MKTIADVKWDDEHKLFKGTFFGGLKIGRRKYTIVKGRLVGGGFSIGGNFDGKYEEFDVASEEDINDILAELQA